MKIARLAMQIYTVDYRSFFEILLQKSAPAGAIPVSELESKVLREQEASAHRQTEHVHREEASIQPVSSKVGSHALYAPLSIKNYQEKFEKLVRAEKATHEGVLRERYVHNAEIIKGSTGSL